jgi:hypothetical protein
MVILRGAKAKLKSVVKPQKKKKKIFQVIYFSGKQIREVRNFIH